MKFTIERAALLKALAHVQSVVERRNTIPILANVRLEGADGALRLTATDMDLAIVERVVAEVAQRHATTVPAHTMYDIVRKLPEGAQVRFEAGADDRVNLIAGRSRFSLPTLPVDDFPVMAEGELPHQFILQAAELKRLIDKTRFAVSTEETRYYLNGIYLHAAHGKGGECLRAVATDGHRLARVEAELPKGAAKMPGVIVPRKAVQELRKLVDEVEGEVKIELSDAKIRFGFDDIVLTSKLIDGTFPDYERVIPEGNDKVLEIGAREFEQAVDRVSTISTEKSRAVKLVIEPKKVTLQASSPDDGSASEEIDAVYKGSPLEIGFNSRYVLDMMAQVKGETLSLWFSDGTSPALVRDSGDSGALYVIMPMRV